MRILHPLACGVLLGLPAAAQIPGTPAEASSSLLSRGKTGARLGASVAMSEDGKLLVAGAPDDDAQANDAGAVKVFDAVTGALLQVLPNPNPAEGDKFGAKVAISGTKVVVGEAMDDTGAINAGSVHVFDLAGGSRALTPLTLHNPRPVEKDNFGSAVAISGTRLLVAFIGGADKTPNAGGAYLYELAGGNPTTPVLRFPSPPTVGNADFGKAVAISGSRILVSSFLTAGSARAGGVYVFDLAGANPAVPILTLNSPSSRPGMHFGIALAISGTRIFVGDSWDGTVASQTGSAYMFDLASATPAVPLMAFHNPEPGGQLEMFGNSVAVAGTTLVVSAIGDDAVLMDAGSAYVYDLASSKPAVPVRRLDNPSPALFDSFGNAVALSGTRLAVGAVNDDTSGGNAGSVYVYELGSAKTGKPAITINNPGGSGR